MLRPESEVKPSKGGYYSLQQKNAPTCSRERIGELQILGCSLFFGASFVCQKTAMDYGIGPWTYSACRNVVSALVMIIFRPLLQQSLHSELKHSNSSLFQLSSHDDLATAAVKSRSSSEHEIHAIEQSNSRSLFDAARANQGWRDLFFYGTICGISNTFGSALQQMGLVTVTAGKTAFITSLYVVLVPLAEFFLQVFCASPEAVQVSWRTWLSAFLSFVGMYLLSGCAEAPASECLGGAFGWGEFFVFISVFCWVASIISSDAGAHKCDCITLTAFDFVVSAALGCFLAYLFEPEEWKYPFTTILSSGAMPYILIVGLTEAAGFTLSTLGQMFVAPSRTSLILTLESVTGAVMGYLFLNEMLTPIELVGACVMFGACCVSSIEADDDDEDEDTLGCDYGYDNNDNKNNYNNSSSSSINNRGGGVPSPPIFFHHASRVSNTESGQNPKKTTTMVNELTPIVIRKFPQVKSNYLDS